MKSLLIDFQQLASDPQRALRGPVQLLTRADMTVLSVESDGKTKRTAGTKFREASIVLADGQRITLRIKETGDIYQVAVNDKTVALREQEDPARAVGEIVGMLDRGRAAFQKRLAAMAVKPPEGMRTAAPRIEETLKQQIAEVDAAISEAEIELARLSG